MQTTCARTPANSLSESEHKQGNRLAHQGGRIEEGMIVKKCINGLRPTDDYSQLNDLAADVTAE